MEGSCYWFVHRKVLQKLRQQFHEEECTSTNTSTSLKIFSGVNIYVTGHTIPSFSMLRQLMGEHGGEFSHYYSASAVTHIVASNLSNSKAKDFRNQKVVRPEWITDSIQQGTLLPWQRYRLQQTLVHGNPSFHSVPTQEPFSHVKQVAVVDETQQTSPSMNMLESPPSPPSPPSHLTLPPSHAPTLQPQSKWYRENTSIAPDFVSKFFRASRLHHLSTWKNELRCYSFAKEPDHNRDWPERPRIIMHIDMDCFFASIGIRERPHLRSKPVGVSHGSVESTTGGSSDVASCNYLARERGVRNGMYLGKAKSLCPDLVILPYEFEKYKEASHQLYGVLRPIADSLQAASCDEALLNVSSYVNIDREEVNRKLDTSVALEPSGITPSTITKPMGVSATSLARYIHREIFALTGCHASIGISTNILLARLATKKAKPSGIYHFHPSTPHDILEFLDPLPVDSLPGVGWNLREKLDGYKTCGDLRKGIPRVSDLQEKLGRVLGERVYQLVRGVDERPVYDKKAEEELVHRKSIGADINWGIRFEKEPQFHYFLRELVKEVVSRMTDPGGFPAGLEQRNDGMRMGWMASAVTLKLRVRHPDAPIEPPKRLGCGHCNAFSHSINLCKPTMDVDVLVTALEAAYTHLKARIQGFMVQDLRGVGVQTGKLSFSGTVGGRSTGRAQNQPDISDLFRRQQERTQQHDGRVSPVNDVALREDFLRASQVDAGVLEELPSDIREEIEQAMEQQKREKDATLLKTPTKQLASPTSLMKRKQEESPSRRTPKQPSPSSLASHWQTTHIQTSSPLKLPNGDRIDPQTWRLLPVSIQRELLDEIRLDRKRKLVVSPLKDRQERVVANKKSKEEKRPAVMVMDRESDRLALCGEWNEVRRELKEWLDAWSVEWTAAVDAEMEELRQHLDALVRCLQWERAYRVLRFLESATTFETQRQALERRILQPVHQAIHARRSKNGKEAMGCT